MYEQYKTDDEIFLNVDGEEFTLNPVATMVNQNSEKIQIAVHDNCYVVAKMKKNGIYYCITHIFKEVFQVLKKLPVKHLNMKPVDLLVGTEVETVEGITGKVTKISRLTEGNKSGWKFLVKHPSPWGESSGWYTAEELQPVRKD